MSDPLTLAKIRLRWNEVLDNLEATDRIAWLVYFDARLAHFEEDVISLDFSDSRKLAGGHEHSPTRSKLESSLLESINKIFGQSLKVIELE